MKSRSKKTIRMPKLIVRRTELPHIAEEFMIYPKDKGPACAICHVSYLSNEWVYIRITTLKEKSWYYHDLSDDQKKRFLHSLLRELRLEIHSDKLITIDIGDISYEFKPND